MPDLNYLWAPPAPVSLPVRGTSARFPVNRLFFVGRNYQAHAREMGTSVDKTTMRPVYFTKFAAMLAESGSSAPYPPETRDYHHEMELVVALGEDGFRVPPEQAAKLIYGYACGLDMTRRDLQAAAKAKGNPWDVAKNVESGAVASEIVPAQGRVLERGEISLRLNGEVRQQGDLADMIWTIPEIIADLSTYYHLRAGDLIYTGTPEGVGPVQVGDLLEGRIEGVGSLSFRIDPAE
ncbi:fumarylacetoacetate hydrolase family protein [Thauera sp.]|uniref:fumarylacetoacetate hydrolase family protein n=1 Tax=Thauera sp. TaxID=1905334 RepID=UPI002C5F7F89|nr:fumarylacetoacetate hydrolase family protein [Thauera sp.]HRP26432.1 fumarylacetoacetate hydrolase family protein [Thauera sp.]